MAEKPFRWNLQNRRSLDAMIATYLAPAPIKVPAPQTGNQKLVVRAQKKANMALQQSIELNADLKRALKKEKRFSEDLLACCARIMALGSEYDLYFVGRSAESIFDHLSGLLFATTFKDRLMLVQLSLRFYSDQRIIWRKALPALKKYFTALKLDPASLMRRRRPVAFVDLVYSGETFFNLCDFLKDWAEESGIPWTSVKPNIKLIGIVERRHTSPNTWRWQQQPEWANMLDSTSIKNISVVPDFWGYLGNDQKKTTASFTFELWGHHKASTPIRTTSTIMGLQSALYWFEEGQSPERRERFAEIVCEQPEMKIESLRKIVLQIRGTSSDTTAKRKVAGRQSEAQRARR
ncbi:MAG: hypothetical protein K2W95_17365 [Candidatus Obscuribacterales bacterium]|nr:hypothetical protein [Candidatus Obscuribacterales bacterium]